jgi:hypothetical protein
LIYHLKLCAVPGIHSSQARQTLKKSDDLDLQQGSGLFIGSEPIDGTRRMAKHDDDGTDVGDKGDDDSTDTGDSDGTDKGDGGDDSHDTDGKD